MRQQAIVNARAVLPDRIEEGVAVLVENGKIAAIGRKDDLPSDAASYDALGATLIPGLVDIHTHGALGYTFNEPAAEAFGAILAANAKWGVASVVGTLAPARMDDLSACLEFARGWMQEAGSGGVLRLRRFLPESSPLRMPPEPAARLLGMHLESPYVNPAQKGALDPESLRTPDDDSADVLLEHPDVLRIVVLAPELPGALPLIEKLAQSGIVVAAGHSMARDEQVREAMDHGLSHVTHLWSAMSSTVREGPWRKPGLLEAGLVFDGLTVEMIADNRHLPPTLMKLAVKCIPPGRLCAISDATSGAGLPEGSEFRMGAMKYEVADGVGMMFDRSAFGGSTTLLGQMLPILTGVVGVSLLDAVTMCTITPARVVGWVDRIGSIETGKLADLVLLDDGLLPARVMIEGQWLDETAPDMNVRANEQRPMNGANGRAHALETGVKKLMTPIRSTVVGALPTVVYSTNADLGAAAAAEAAEILRQAVAARGVANAILATGNSQLTFLQAIAQLPNVGHDAIPWERVNLFHMDEYVNLPEGHPASFPAFLQRHLVQKVGPKAFFPVKAEGDVDAACRTYEALLRQFPADLTVMGIGENGHLAFNDPPYADFDDPVWVKVVQLDEKSRRQQVGEGHFGSLDEVPTHAITVTIPALLAAKRVLVLVPERRKAEAVSASLIGPIVEDCPASILRTQPHAKLFLDVESAALLPESIWMGGQS